jgi:hypothetical protein
LGNNSITRYEMAQMIAKAMARADRADAAQRAQIDRLAAEFSRELQALGVRVGRLERRTDNVTITGELRFQTVDWGGDTSMADEYRLRTRLNVVGQINDNWTARGMFEHNGMNFRTNAHGGQINAEGRFTEGAMVWRRGWVQGRVSNVDVRAGTFAFLAGLPGTPGTVTDTCVTGLALALREGDWNFQLAALRPTMNGMSTAVWDTRVQAYHASITGRLADPLDVYLGYWTLRPRGVDGNVNIVDVMTRYNIDRQNNVWAQYIRNSSIAIGNTDATRKYGWALGFNHGNLNRARPDTYALRLVYSDVSASSVFNFGGEFKFNSPSHFSARQYDGLKVWQIGASYMLARNVEFALDYLRFQNLAREVQIDKEKSSILWTRMLFYF